MATKILKIHCSKIQSLHIPGSSENRSDLKCWSASQRSRPLHNEIRQLQYLSLWIYITWHLGPVAASAIFSQQKKLPLQHSVANKREMNLAHGTSISLPHKEAQTKPSPARQVKGLQDLRDLFIQKERERQGPMSWSRGSRGRGGRAG